MNSIERKQERYLRRKQKREERVIKNSLKYSNIDSIFVFHKVLKYADKCCNGVRHKKSTFLFQNHMFTIIAKTCNDIKNNTYKVGKTYKFTINERGKIRHIDAPFIKDRLVHKVLSNEVLVRIYNKHLIYDNGASQKNKGFIFALTRVKNALIKYYRKYGLNGYVLLIDYSKFFDNCSHNIIKEYHNKLIRNNYTTKVIEDYLFIDTGIALGIELAQREASILPNILDHFIENKGYFIERYMDDTIILINSLKDAKNILKEYTYLANKLDIKINSNKTKMVSLNEYFMYCKWHFELLDTGKVIMIPDKKTIYRQRRKLKKMVSKNIVNEINIVKTCFKTYLNIGNSYKYIKWLDNY